MKCFFTEDEKRLVDDYLKQNEPGTHVLFVINIDHFHTMTDRFGRSVGDTIIADMSRKIRESFRNTDLAGRIGGDEFVVFMKATTEFFAQIKAEQICEKVRKVVYGGDERLQVTVSVGGAIYGKDGESYAELFDKADAAMCAVKAEGGDGFCFYRTHGHGEGRKQKWEKADDGVANGENVDRELMNQAFKLLSHAKDMDLSLNLLLEQIAGHFALNLVTVFVYDSKRPQMTVTNSWSNLGKLYERDVIPRTWRLFENEPVGVFVELADLMKSEDMDEVSKARYAEWNQNKIQNMAAVKFEIANGTVGELMIGTAKEGISWNEREVDTICELSRIVGVFVSLRNQSNVEKKEMNELRQRDRLTGLYLNETFKTKVENIMKVRAAGCAYAVAVMDINNFAYVNENFGTEVGDKILRDLAELLNNGEARTKFSCRMYSDYFATFMSGSTQAELVEKVRIGTREFETRLNEKYPIGKVSLSVGICFIHTPEEYELVMENANIARKYAKEQGILSGVVFDNYMRHKRDELVEVSSKFNDAVLNKEFEVYLQPKFLTNSWEVYGAEALVRWHQGDGTVTSPVRFVPFLEMTGQILELDFIIFEKVLAVMQKWQRQGKKPVVISVNFSRRHFERSSAEFVNRVHELVEKYQVPAEYIEIEITESAVVHNLDVIRKNLESLKGYGLRIAIDDFGTGYSSLNALLEIPADVIKMDKSFTDKLHLEKHRYFVSQLGLLIKAASQEVIFEGIETEEQLDYLKNSGFLYGQGYIFDRPITVDEFERKYLGL